MTALPQDLVRLVGDLRRRWRLLPSARRRRTVAVLWDAPALDLHRAKVQPFLARQLPSWRRPEGERDEDLGAWCISGLYGRGWVVRVAKVWPHPVEFDLDALSAPSETFSLVVFLALEAPEAPAPCAFLVRPG